MPRGGRRQGTPGKSYNNRADLRTAHPLPIQTAPGQPYGSQTAQAQSQAAVPLASGQLPDQGAALGDAQSFQPPTVPQMGDPSALPGQAVTAGIGASGPAPGSQPGGDPLLRGVALLNSLGASVSPEVKALRNVVGAQQANAAAP
jgi:hypothetical protein